MSTAQDFEVGDRVTMTDLGRARLWPEYSRQSTVNGTVVGHSRDGASVRIRREGHVDVNTYHPDFWRRFVHPRNMRARSKTG